MTEYRQASKDFKNDRQFYQRLDADGNSSNVSIHWRCHLGRYLIRQASSFSFLQGRVDGSNVSFG